MSSGIWNTHMTNPITTVANRSGSDITNPPFIGAHLRHKDVTDLPIAYVRINLRIQGNLVKRADLQVRKVSACAPQDSIPEVCEFNTVICPIGNGKAKATRKVELPLHGQR